MGKSKFKPDGSIRGYVRSREYTEQEVRDLPIGHLIWIQWCKDDDPERERFNGAYQITSTDLEVGEFEVHTGDGWEFDGDTNRGTAHYYEAILEIHMTSV